MNKQELFEDFCFRVMADSLLDNRTRERAMRHLQKVLGLVSEEEKTRFLALTQSIEPGNPIKFFGSEYQPFSRLDHAIMTAQNLGINVLAIVGTTDSEVTLTPEGSTRAFVNRNPQEAAREISNFLYEEVSS